MTVAPQPSPEEIDRHLDAVLQASGSKLKYYTTPKTLAAMRQAMATAMMAMHPKT